MTQSAKTFGRRDVLRGTGVVALAAVVPLVAKAEEPGADAELMRFGDECLKLARETARLRKTFQKAADRADVAFAATDVQRWSVSGYGGGGQLLEPVSNDVPFQVYGVDMAPRWHAHCLGRDYPESLVGKWFHLEATTKEEAEHETRALGIKLDREFFAARARAGKSFKQQEHFKNWSEAHNKLRRAFDKLAKLRATTPQGLNMKAMVLAVAHDAWDDPYMWGEKLQASIMADINKNAAIAA